MLTPVHRMPPSPSFSPQEGSFGSVRVAVHKASGATHAVKSVALRRASGENALDTILAEVGVGVSVYACMHVCVVCVFGGWNGFTETGERHAAREQKKRRDWRQRYHACVILALSDAWRICVIHHHASSCTMHGCHGTAGAARLFFCAGIYTDMASLFFVLSFWRR